MRQKTYHPHPLILYCTPSPFLHWFAALQPL
jgi:hypothetical protein